jgi:hypothetical protein
MDETKTEARRRLKNLKSVGQEMVEEEKELLEKHAAKAAKAVEGAGKGS